MDLVQSSEQHRQENPAADSQAVRIARVQIAAVVDRFSKGLINETGAIKELASLRDVSPALLADEAERQSARSGGIFSKALAANRSRAATEALAHLAASDQAPLQTRALAAAELVSRNDTRGSAAVRDILTKVDRDSAEDVFKNLASVGGNVAIKNLMTEVFFNHSDPKVSVAAACAFPQLLLDAKVNNLSGFLSRIVALSEATDAFTIDFVNVMAKTVKQFRQPSELPALAQAGYQLLNSDSAEARLVGLAVFGELVSRRIPNLEKQFAADKPNTPESEKFHAKFLNEFATVLRQSAATLSGPEAKKLTDYADALLKTREVGISNPYRFRSDSLATIVRDRLDQQRGVDTSTDKRPLAILALAQWDDAGALLEAGKVYKEFTNNGYRVLVFETGTDTGLLESLKAGAGIGTTRQRAADTIVIFGHGNQTQVALGTVDPGKNSIPNSDKIFDVSDKERFIAGGVGDTLTKGGQIVLVACSTGKGRESEGNITNVLREIFPHAGARQIFSPERDADALQLNLHFRDGKFIRVDFGTSSPVYQTLNRLRLPSLPDGNGA